MARKKKSSPEKKVSYQHIPEALEPEMYSLLNELIDSVHDHLTNARIALAWNLSWKADVDGKVVLGKAKKASDLDRELAPFDFVLIFNRGFYKNHATPEQRKALMDHELSHCEVALDKDGDLKRDSKDRVCYRIRKHDIEEFVGVVERNGIYKRDLEVFAASLLRKDGQASLGFGDGEIAGAVADLIPEGSGIDSVTISSSEGSATLTAETANNVRKILRTESNAESLIDMADAATRRKRGKKQPPAAPQSKVNAITVTAPPRSCADCGGKVTKIDDSGVYACADEFAMGCAWTAVVEPQDTAEALGA